MQRIVLMCFCIFYFGMAAEVAGQSTNQSPGGANSSSGKVQNNTATSDAPADKKSSGKKKTVKKTVKKNKPAYTPAVARRWASVSAGISSGRVGIGFATGNSSAAAASAARYQCGLRVGNCRTVNVWSSGCYFITFGDGLFVAWGAGPTADRAYSACAKRGAFCRKKTLGTCL